MSPNLTLLTSLVMTLCWMLIATIRSGPVRPLPLVVSPSQRSPHGR
jgi:hypothetical protein